MEYMREEMRECDRRKKDEREKICREKHIYISAGSKGKGIREGKGLKKMGSKETMHNVKKRMCRE